uniref:ArfGAP with dual PH domains 1 n=1 Tax=Leptobrachium leishanense TaxID=445787 RepID=A0A8C5QPG9_9ANUR
VTSDDGFFCSLAGYREGLLWKRGRDNGQFLSRKFVLSEREGALKYFNKNDAKEPKAIMKIEHLNATFQPAKIGNPNGLQITYLKDNSTRNIFVYHEDGKEIVDWYNAIRAARFHYLQVAYPGLVPKLTRNFLNEGFMEKTGPKVRFHCIHSRFYLLGIINPITCFSPKENRYEVQEGLPSTVQGTHWQYGITIVTPDRMFLFTCENDVDHLEWISAFRKVLSKPMLPQEYAGNFTLDLAHSPDCYIQSSSYYQDQNFNEHALLQALFCMLLPRVPTAI